MASVVSIGLSSPAGLSYAIQEGYLPVDPPNSYYTWKNYASHGFSSNFENDELLITSRCVIWSRRDVFRKCYNFDMEKETVSHALLTTFPSVGPLAKKQKKFIENDKTIRQKEAAIVVFLQTQAHVYFLFGTSHVIHLPFEVESAFAAPTGVIMQRRIETHVISDSSKVSKIPQNSSVSPMIQSFSLSGSLRSSLSTADHIESKQKSHQSSIKTSIRPCPTKIDTSRPRLFFLPDPLSEIGLIVAQQPILEKDELDKSAVTLFHLDPAEEMIYVSCQDDNLSNHAAQSPMIALTWNLNKLTYTVWVMTYPTERSNVNDRAKLIGREISRRRSSYAPTGTTTPLMSRQQNIRDSSYGSQSTNPRKSLKIDGSREKVVDFVSALDPDFEGRLSPRRRSRRVSSMLARADFSNSHERSTFSDLSTNQQHVINRRGESLGSQNARASMGTFETSTSSVFPSVPQTNQSFTGLNEINVNRAAIGPQIGEDFEGLGSIGIDDGDFSTLKHEIVLTKIDIVSPEYATFRSSIQTKPTFNQRKVFMVAPPFCASDDVQESTSTICILDPNERKLITVSLNIKTSGQKSELAKPENQKSEKGETTVSLGSILLVDNVIDACRIDDVSVSRILVLTETDDGCGELTLQAPWSSIMKIPLPTYFSTARAYNMSPQSSSEKRDSDLITPRAFLGLRNSRPSGQVGLLDDEGNVHQLRILMQPKNPHVCKIIEVCRVLLNHSDIDTGPFNQNDNVLVCWWNVMVWLRSVKIDASDPEWTSLIITLLGAAFGVDYSEKFSQDSTNTEHIFFQNDDSDKNSRNLVDSWGLMLRQETKGGSSFPSWMENTGWAWLTGRVDFDSKKSEAEPSVSIFEENIHQSESFIQEHVKFTRQYLETIQGKKSILQYISTWNKNSLEIRQNSLRDLFIGLHLLREEQKLDVMVCDSYSTGRVSLTIYLAQIARWLGWPDWVKFYATEEESISNSGFDDDTPIRSTIKQPFECPNIYSWINKCLNIRSASPFITIFHLVSKHAVMSDRSLYDQCMRFTPRTFIFEQFFQLVTADWIPSQIVESFSLAGGDIQILETLPEAIVAPLQEAIMFCESQPPTNWNKNLLTLVGREDVNLSIKLGQKKRVAQPVITESSHESNMDVHRICISLFETEITGAFDGNAEAERHSITRLIFNDDKRINEAVQILDTTRATVAICKPEPQWSESEMLEAQKEHAQVLANRTLAIPSGRGLLYYSSRTPLLTQKWHISGFNLSCLMKPEGNIVTPDKTAFTEEKVSWAFFHTGVAAGLQISRNAKGIDTSWILYNKPPPNLLNNRHAGFLLALGLNGHLKSLAKWVAFKYLTPKHTMTSIGLLLGLAASYIGTMDTLVTRLLSVHVTRMLPPGAAELNLSPLTQTTGLMGIGLLYCNTQHRRMSEIMVSEIENIDIDTDEESLRNESYRLAAGFALGFINLGKGSDLMGLHDMRLTERLLILATGSKKVDIIHVLDKANAAAVMAIALIFMKSENQILARKIDVPESLVQFDYVRPDIFLLRTVTSRLIMWSKIEASFEWIQKNLPKEYRYQSNMDTVDSLRSEDLAFYDIITGLCFSIALRFAGSSCHAVRDILIHYLDQFMRIYQIEAPTYDTKLTRNTVRNCQDLLALSAATVMAGTGDLTVFRRLRSLHGRDDADTPYGSHLVAHIAIGALFIGGGTFTFGTSNLAIGALLVAFYPILPGSVHDNRSHLQAFRHFWTLAAEPRCFVAKDIETNQPVAIPIKVTPREGNSFMRQSPCLLPELNQIKYICTSASDFWNLSFDLENNISHITAFKSMQTIYVHRRPFHSCISNPFNMSILALSDAENVLSHPLEWIFKLPTFESLTKAEKALILPTLAGGSCHQDIEARGNVVDARLVLEKSILESGKKDRLLGLSLLYDWIDRAVSENREPLWIRKEVMERMKTKIWLMIMAVKE
ncbi:Negative regulator of mitosis [Golovinomyces cichoracearum]|uniref:Negative regulator of mitosis n=1 Tax=Golovinomyces cichoracearum TaxID=62708 RepID=A0A420IW63_9PEZI|nr:Negative regulator of mitosis [Golovinomyces cichoracearum]